MAYRTAGLGYSPDLADFRDIPYVKPNAPVAPSANLFAGMPPIWSQLNGGTCVGHGVNRNVEYVFRKNGQLDFMPSRLLTYYNARLFEGTESYDSGAQIRDGIKAVASYGVADEAEWAYDLSNINTRPPQNVYDDAAKHLAISYYRLDPDLDQIRACINEGFPIVFGMTVYESFESAQTAQTGDVKVPAPGEAPIGGHCMVGSGYDDSTRFVDVDNSWGENWGRGGRCRIPYQLFTDGTVSDIWTIRAES